MRSETLYQEGSMFQSNRSQESQSYARIGTTSPIFVPRSDKPASIRPGKDYLFIQIHSAQAAFHGSIWDQVDNLIVATKVKLNYPNPEQEGLRAIQRTRKVSKDRAEQLGLSPNLISLIPAVMPELSITIDFILDVNNNLQNLSNIINSDSLFTAISLAPGAALVAKTISSLADKIISNFIPAQEQQPILQFSGDFNLAVGNLLNGFYVILGTKDVRNPLPDSTEALQISGSNCLLNGKQITQLSYIVLDIRSTPVRTREMNGGALWNLKLNEAEDEARRVGSDPLAKDVERKEVWQKCKNLIKEAQALLRNDPNYLRVEADNIIKECFARCCQDLEIKLEVSPISSVGRGWQPNMYAERSELEIFPQEDLVATMAAYQERASEARRIFQEANLTPELQ